MGEKGFGQMLVLCLGTWLRIIYKLDCKEFQISWNGKNAVESSHRGYTFVDGDHFFLSPPLTSTLVEEQIQ